MSQHVNAQTRAQTRTETPVRAGARASSSNSFNRAQTQSANCQARSNYMQQATCRLPSLCWPWATVGSISPLHSPTLHSPSLALPYPEPCSYKIISLEINKLKPVGRTGNEGLCDSSYQLVESARGSVAEQDSPLAYSSSPPPRGTLYGSCLAAHRGLGTRPSAAYEMRAKNADITTQCRGVVKVSAINIMPGRGRD